MPHALLVDGHNSFIRHYVVNPTLDQNGQAVGGFVGFVRSLASTVESSAADLCVVVWDGEGGSARRRRELPGYKSGRRMRGSVFSHLDAGREVRLNREYDVPPSVELVNLHRQLDMCRRYSAMLGAVDLCVDDVEADDVLAFAARHVLDGWTKLIVSTDRDFLQLVDGSTRVLNPIKKRVYDAAAVLAELGVLPENLVLARAIEGDDSDSIPGVAGVGMKTVAAAFPVLAERPVDLSEFLRCVSECPGRGARARAIRESVELVTRNVGLMQLSNPTVSAASAAAVRAAIARSTSTVSQSDFTIALIRDGVQLSYDAVAPFRAMTNRRKGA